MMMMKSFPTFCSLNFLSEETFGQTLEFRNQKLKNYLFYYLLKNSFKMKFVADSLLKMNFQAKVRQSGRMLSHLRMFQCVSEEFLHFKQPFECVCEFFPSSNKKVKTQKSTHALRHLQMC